MRTLASSIAATAIALGLTIPIATAVPRSGVWVSHNIGTDVVGCNSDQNPCRTFAFALANAVPPGGVIRCLDSGSFGPVAIINQSVTIDCTDQHGSIDADLGNAITIQGTGLAVTLRGLKINGGGDLLNSGGQYGITISASGAVTIENCVIQNFTVSSGAGISVTPGSGSLRVNVADTLITNNTDGSHNAGMVILPTGSGNTTFALDRVRLENNARGGLLVDPSGSAAVTGVIRDGVVTGNGDFGIFVSSGGPNVTVSLDHTHVAGNNTGIAAFNGVAVILNNSTIQTNGTGLFAQTGAAIFSYGNNAINGNQPNGSATPIVIGLH